MEEKVFFIQSNCFNNIKVPLVFITINMPPGSSCFELLFFRYGDKTISKEIISIQLKKTKRFN